MLSQGAEDVVGIRPSLVVFRLGVPARQYDLIRCLEGLPTGLNLDGGTLGIRVNRDDLSRSSPHGEASRQDCGAGDYDREPPGTSARLVVWGGTRGVSFA